MINEDVVHRRSLLIEAGNGNNQYEKNNPLKLVTHGGHEWYMYGGRFREKITVPSPHWDAWAKSLTPGELAAFHHYKEHGSVNSIARRGKLSPDERGTAAQNKAAHAALKNLDTAIAKGRLPEDTVVYRGVRGDVKTMLAVGTVYEDKGFTSTSIYPQVAKQFGQIGHGGVIRVTLPKGTHAARVEAAKQIHLYGMVADEGEILLPRNTRIKIVAKQGGYYEGKLLK